LIKPDIQVGSKVWLDPVLLMYSAESSATFVISSSAGSRIGVASQSDRRMVKGGRTGRKVVEEHIPTRNSLEARFGNR
jgi:hypothetical protein